MRTWEGVCVTFKVPLRFSCWRQDPNTASTLLGHRGSEEKGTLGHGGVYLLWQHRTTLKGFLRYKCAVISWGLTRFHRTFRINAAISFHWKRINTIDISNVLHYGNGRFSQYGAWLVGRQFLVCDTVIQWSINEAFTIESVQVNNLGQDLIFWFLPEY